MTGEPEIPYIYGDKPNRYSISFAVRRWDEIVDQLVCLSPGNRTIKAHGMYVGTYGEARAIVTMLYDHVLQVIDWGHASPHLVFYRNQTGAHKGLVSVNDFKDD